MLPESYARQKIKKYGCTIHSATGILNWMGRLKGSISDTYNEIWNNSNVELHDNGGEDWLYGGAYLEDVKNYFNSYFASLGIKTRAFIDSDVTFDEVVRHIGSNYSGEKAPFSMSIWVEGDDGHTITVISYLKTSSKNYVVIYNGWWLDENDCQVDENGIKANVNNNTSYLSVRYIDFDDLKNRSNVSTEGMMFKDVQSANIKEANTQYSSGNNIELACYVPNGTKYVFFPTWSVGGNGTDVVWHSGNIQYGNVASVSVDLNTYNKASGYYATDIYAYDGNMNQLACYGTVLNDINSNISNVKTSNKTIKGYKLTCNLPTGTARVAFPTWSNVNNQDDLIWYNGQINNNNGNLQGEITIDVANHKNDGGLYITHIYAYDKYNKLIANDVNGRADITDRKQITDAKITNVTSSSYRVSCKVPTGTSYVLFPTWTSYNASDDIIWYNAALSGDTAYLTINKSKHNNETGVYNTHIYAFNSKGDILNSATTSVTIK